MATKVTKKKGQKVVVAPESKDKVAKIEGKIKPFFLALVRPTAKANGLEIQQKKINKHMASMKGETLNTLSAEDAPGGFFLSETLESFILDPNIKGFIMSKPNVFRDAEEFTNFLFSATEQNKTVIVLSWGKSHKIPSILKELLEWNKSLAVTPLKSLSSIASPKISGGFGKVEIAPATERTIVQLFKDHKMNPNAIFKKLNDENIPTARGGKWTRNTIVRILKRNGCM